MRRLRWTLLVAPLLAASADAAVSAEESRISIDLVVLIVIALVPILFMIVGCVACKWYWRREQRSREVRRVQEKKQRRKEVERHRKEAQSSKGSESSGAHSQQSGSDTQSSPQQQDKRWAMAESRLEWIVPQCANQVDGNGSEVMFAVPAVRVVVPQRSRQHTSSRSVQAEAEWVQDIPGTVASSPPRLRGTPSSVRADSNSPSSSIELSEMDNQTYQRPSSSVFPPLTLLA